ncbi:MAG: hypothetical protein HS116_18985 [Planctomycetes bacterium]|nr:hypothetical protein [Planctomycetota bacterium]
MAVFSPMSLTLGAGSEPRANFKAASKVNAFEASARAMDQSARMAMLRKQLQSEERARMEEFGFKREMADRESAERAAERSYRSQESAQERADRLALADREHQYRTGRDATADKRYEGEMQYRTGRDAAGDSFAQRKLDLEAAHQNAASEQDKQRIEVEYKKIEQAERMQQGAQNHAAQQAQRERDYRDEVWRRDPANRIKEHVNKVLGAILAGGQPAQAGSDAGEMEEADRLMQENPHLWMDDAQEPGYANASYAGPQAEAGAVNPVLGRILNTGNPGAPSAGGGADDLTRQLDALAPFIPGYKSASQRELDALEVDAKREELTRRKEGKLSPVEERQKQTEANQLAQKYVYDGASTEDAIAQAAAETGVEAEKIRAPRISTDPAAIAKTGQKLGFESDFAAFKAAMDVVIDRSPPEGINITMFGNKDSMDKRMFKTALIDDPQYKNSRRFELTKELISRGYPEPQARKIVDRYVSDTRLAKK